MTQREIKPNLGRVVLHIPSGAKYRLTGGIIRRDENSGDCWYQAELQDLTALRSVMICKLEDLEILKE